MILLFVCFICTVLQNHQVQAFHHPTSSSLSLTRQRHHTASTSTTCLFYATDETTTEKRQRSNNELLFQTRLSIEAKKRKKAFSIKSARRAKAILETRLLERQRRRQQQQMQQQQTEEQIEEIKNQGIAAEQPRKISTMEALLSTRLSFEDIKRSIESSRKAEASAKAILETRLSYIEKQQKWKEKRKQMQQQRTIQKTMKNLLTTRLTLEEIKRSIEASKKAKANAKLLLEARLKARNNNSSNKQEQTRSSDDDEIKDSDDSIIFDESDFQSFQELKSFQQQSGRDDDDTSMMLDLASSSSSIDSLLMTELKQRTEQIHQEKVLSKWKSCNCDTKMMPINIPGNNNEWIRRIDIDTYPYAVCGTSHGSLYLIDISSGNVLDYQQQIHDPIGSKDSTHIYKALYSNFDGLGTVAVAIKNNLVLSAGREGGVIAWHIDKDKKLVLLGRLMDDNTSSSSLDETIVTSIKFGSVNGKDQIWIAGYDGMIRVFDVNSSSSSSDTSTTSNDDVSLPNHLYTIDFQTTKEAMTKEGEGASSSSAINNNEPILDLDIDKEIQCGVCTTLHGTIYLFSLLDGSSISSTKSKFARSVLIVKQHQDQQSSSPSCNEVDDNNNNNDNDNNHMKSNKWFVVIGYTDGKMNMIELKQNKEKTMDINSGKEEEEGKHQFMFDIDNSHRFNTTGTNNNTINGLIDGLPSTFSAPSSSSSPKRYDRTKLPLRAHTGPVMCLTKLPSSTTTKNTSNSNIFLSAGQDTSIRIWEVESTEQEEKDDDADTNNLQNGQQQHHHGNKEHQEDNKESYYYYPKCLYVLSRYKLWLTNVCISNDGLHLLSDGTDNTIVVRDFTPSDE